MSVLVSILFVVGLFAAVGFAAWVAVMFGLTNPRGAVARPSVLDASFDQSRETVSV